MTNRFAPARGYAYADGGSFSVVIEHDGRTVVVHSSGNFIEGALKGYRADTVFLGIAGLARQDEAFQRGYWNEVVAITGARRVVPIHWDDFRLPLDQPLVPMLRLGYMPPFGGGDFSVTMDSLVDRGRADGVEVRLLYAWTPVNPFR